ncbi:hypothetical protein KBA84_04780 [Patescibacteria group bacterium]|nr:hypothetical protein [Patescibacteria group bacterium]
MIVRDRVEYDLSSAFLRLSEGQDVLFVSGPGSFTNLRVAGLVINLARRLVSGKNSLFAIDKIALYSFLIDKKLLPPQGILYIGQTKNFWLYDFVRRSYTVVNGDFVPDGQYFVDQISDRYFDVLADKKVGLGVDGDNLVLSFAGALDCIAFVDIPMQSVDVAVPEYMIEPVIG